MFFLFKMCKKVKTIQFYIQFIRINAITIFPSNFDGAKSTVS